MTLPDLIHSSIDSLNRTRGRSILTMIGIVIGILSVILVLSIGEAAQRYILGQISAFGSDIIFVQNGPEVDANQPSLFNKESLTIRDVKKLQSYSWVDAIVGKVQISDLVSANGFDTNASIVGTMSDELNLNDIRVKEGSFISSASVDGHAREVVLGSDIANAAFGAENPIGKNVKIGGQGFRVIGVMEKAGSKGFTNIDKQVYIPVTAALDLYNKKFISQISVKSNITLEDAKERIRVAIRERHNIDNAEDDRTKDDFHTQTQEDLIKSSNQITNILQILLTSIAAISLLVGGIGIMNIMYVAVTERTREIGLRKSIGARRSDILNQFLVESIFLTVLGGIIGTFFGITFSWVGIKIINSFQGGWTFAISWQGIGLGIIVSAAIGVIFGYFPARRASGLSPIEALRFE
ncbi:ABC transporter permease [Candidatus Uhrbacteria bacterium]|nr:ABC transporter permease [Candidatus Uhrbacteria bacterium]